MALFVGVLLARTITNPIKELTTATTAVAQGELGRQVDVHSKDEIGALANSFNQMSTDLSNASQYRRQMTADIAHELRTPLSIILGYTESLRDGVLPPDADTFHILHDEAEHLSRLVQDLRTLSLADAGKLTLHWQAVPPVELLQTVAAKYRHQAEQQRVVLTIEEAANLPEIEVDPDRDRIALFAQNLLGQGVVVSYYDRYIRLLPSVMVEPETLTSACGTIRKVYADTFG